jgi:hypothetical protein
MIVWGRNSKGERISISQAARGANDQLRCECGANLVARKGEINAHHFAHASDGSGDCRKAHFGALCELASRALSREPGLLLPRIGHGPRCIRLETFKIQAFGEFTGLCAGTTTDSGTHSLAIIVNLKRSEQRPPLAMFKSLDISAILIDLAPYRNCEDQTLEEALRSTADRSWIYNRKKLNIENIHGETNSKLPNKLYRNQRSREYYENLTMDELILKLFGEDR